MKEGNDINLMLIAGNTLLALGSCGSVLLALQRSLSLGANLELVGLMFAEVIALLVGTLLSSERDWKQLLRAMMGIQVVALGLTLASLSDLAIGYRIELGCLVVGAMLLMLAHLGWYRERQKEAWVSATFVVGTMLVTLPICTGLIGHRVLYADFAGWRWFHEVICFLGGLILLGTGVLFQLRSTTIGGVSMLGVFVASLLLLIHLPQQLQNASIWMMVGGAAFFGTALLLSVYRERLVAIPRKVKAGEGVFQVFKWR
ncbi:MAG: hypothetical protein R3C03_15210 [Pirellulaceae bacterium]